MGNRALMREAGRLIVNPNEVEELASGVIYADNCLSKAIYYDSSVWKLRDREALKQRIGEKTMPVLPSGIGVIGVPDDCKDLTDVMELAKEFLYSERARWYAPPVHQ